MAHPEQAVLSKCDTRATTISGMAIESLISEMHISHLIIDMHNTFDGAAGRLTGNMLFKLCEVFFKINMFGKHVVQYPSKRLALRSHY
jgi:hypothetical protein